MSRSTLPMHTSKGDTETIAPHVAASAMDSLRRVVRALRAANTVVEREHRVSVAQLFVLRQVAEFPGQSLRELAQRTLTTQSTVSEVVSRLVDHGMIVREVASNDRRRAVLRLSAAGCRVLSDAPETVQEQLVDGFHSLPPDTQTALASGLASWLSAAGLNQELPTMFLEE